MEGGRTGWRGIRGLGHGDFGSGYSAVTGCRNASSSKDRFAEALVFRLAAQGAIREPGGKSLVCLVPDVNENQFPYLSRSLTVCTENLSSGVVVVKSAKDGA